MYSKKDVRFSSHCASKTTGHDCRTSGILEPLSSVLFLACNFKIQH